MYHDIDPKDFNLFESQMLNIKKGWMEIHIDPKDLDKISQEII